MVVVLPVPFTPTTKMTCGRCSADAPLGGAGTARRTSSNWFFSASRSWSAPCSDAGVGGRVAHGFEQFARGAHAEIGGQQSVFQALELFRVEAAAAAEDAFDARGKFRARLADRLLQAVEQRRFGLLFVVAEQMKS